MRLETIQTKYLKPFSRKSSKKGRSFFAKGRLQPNRAVIDARKMCVMYEKIAKYM